MATRIYGASDDLIEIEGDVEGEYDCFDQDTILRCDDGTELYVHYGKSVDIPGGRMVERGIWSIGLLRPGSLFDHIDECDDEDADPYSDVAIFKEGLHYVYASDWEDGQQTGEWRKVE